MAITNKGIGIRFPLRRSTQGAFEVNRTTVDAVRDSLKILLLTNHGERVINYEMGCNLRSLLFEQDADLQEKIRTNIISAVETWMPFVGIDAIEVETRDTNQSLSENEFKIKIQFSVGQLKGKLEQSIKQ